MVSALAFIGEKSLLAQGLIDKAEKKSEIAFQLFKSVKKSTFSLSGFSDLFWHLRPSLILYVFPAATQLEANDIEQEKQIIKELEKSK